MIYTLILIIIILILLILAFVFTVKEHHTTNDKIIDAYYRKHFNRFADPVVKRFYQNKDSFFINNSLNKYLEQVIKGKEYCKEKNLVIAGLLRNCKHNIPFLKHHVQQMSKVFTNVFMIIVENDSTDGSREELLLWSEENKNIVILCDNNLVINQKFCNIQKFKTEFSNHDADSARIKRLAFLRNIYLDYIRNHEWLRTFDFLMILDLDLKGYIFEDGLFHSLNMFQENHLINGISCNGIIYKLGETLIYYDSFAYIEPNAKYVWNTIEQKNEHDRYVNKIISKRYQDTIDLDPVFSAFGGLCIYRMNMIINKKINYDYSVDGYACEHSFFNKNISNIYVNPRMIFLIMNNH